MRETRPCNREHLWKTIGSRYLGTTCLATLLACPSQGSGVPGTYVGTIERIRRGDDLLHSPTAPSV